MYEITYTSKTIAKKPWFGPQKIDKYTGGLRVRSWVDLMSGIEDLCNFRGLLITELEKTCDNSVVYCTAADDRTVLRITAVAICNETIRNTGGIIHSESIKVD